MSSPPTIALLHGAGYVGGELVRLLANHPAAHLCAVTSRTFAGMPVHTAHSALRGQVDLAFTAPEALELGGVDAVVTAAEHGRGMHVVRDLRAQGFEGSIIDLSADFRFADPAHYPAWFGTDHVAPHLLEEAVYGLPEVTGGPAPGTALVANPGCFATGITLALAPLARQDAPMTAAVTALTGASGSGASPSAATHFPDRDGNVRPYKVLAHQHVPEVYQTLGDHVQVNFVPASGPWTRGIWGTVQVTGLDVPEAAVTEWFQDAYADAPCVRLTPGALPALKPAVHTPFCDLGWQVENGTLVVGFALDNLLKGAASQAVQNLNAVLGLPGAMGLIATANRGVALAR